MRGNELIKQIEQCENNLMSLLNDTNPHKIEFNIEEENIIIEKFFSQTDLTKKSIEEFSEKISNKIDFLRNKLEHYKKFRDENNEIEKRVDINNNIDLQNEHFTSHVKDKPKNCRENFITIFFNSNEINVWNFENGLLLNNRKLKGHDHGVWCMIKAFMNDKNLLLTGGGDDLIKIWDLDDETCFKKLNGHKGC